MPPEVRNISQKEGGDRYSQCRLRWAQPFPRTGCVLHAGSKLDTSSGSIKRYAATLTALTSVMTRIGPVGVGEISMSVRTSRRSRKCSAWPLLKGNRTALRYRGSPRRIVQDRAASQTCRLERMAGCGIIARRRTNSAHLHRPWRAHSTPEHDLPRVGPFLPCRSTIRPPHGGETSRSDYGQALPHGYDLGRH